MHFFIFHHNIITSSGLSSLFLHLLSCFPLVFRQAGVFFSWYFADKSSTDFHTGPRPLAHVSVVGSSFFSPVFLVPTRLFQSSSRTSASSVLVLPGCGTLSWTSRAGRAGFCWDWSCVKLQQCYLTRSYPSSAGMLSFPAGHRSTIKKPKASAWN